MNRVFLVGFALCGMFAASALPATPQCDAATMIRRSVQVNAEDWNAAPQYEYFERDGDPKGGSKTYENLMIVGSPYQRLVAVNGGPLPPERQAEEERKLQAAILARKKETPQEREQRISKYERERRRDQVLLEQMTRALDFQVIGEQTLGPNEVCVFKAKPHPGFEPSSREAKVLTGMEGKLWIDTKTFQWVKVEAHVIHPVSIEGFLAEVDAGTRFELEKMPVDDGIWLFKHFEMKSKAKILFFFTHRTQANETYYDYQKAAPPDAGLQN
jgi:hypothetical protein